jgi:hypothetical protein
MTGPEIASWLAQTGFAAAAAVGALFLALPGKIGDRIVGFRFDRKLAQLKDQQDREIERLRDRLRHFEDRSKRSNEKEYEAIAEIWNQFIDVVQSTERAVTQFIEHPDLSRLNNEEIARFLATASELSDDQRQEIVKASDKNRAYLQSLTWVMLAKAHNQIFQLRADLKKRSIFIPEKLVAHFEAATEFCAKAEIAEFVRFRHPNSTIGHDDTIKFLEQKDAILLSVRDATRNRLLRDLDGKSE